MKTFIDSLKAKFENKLMRKTNWGRNEIREVFNEAIQEALIELVEPVGKLRSASFLSTSSKIFKAQEGEQ